MTQLNVSRGDIIVLPDNDGDEKCEDYILTRSAVISYLAMVGVGVMFEGRFSEAHDEVSLETKILLRDHIYRRISELHNREKNGKVIRMGYRAKEADAHDSLCGVSASLRNYVHSHHAFCTEYNIRWMRYANYRELFWAVDRVLEKRKFYRRVEGLLYQHGRVIVSREIFSKIQKWISVDAVVCRPCLDMTHEIILIVLHGVRRVLVFSDEEVLWNALVKLKLGTVSFNLFLDEYTNIGRPVTAKFKEGVVLSQYDCMMEHFIYQNMFNSDSGKIGENKVNLDLNYHNTNMRIDPLPESVPNLDPDLSRSP